MDLASKKKILVVDDDPDIRSFLSACLEEAGFMVETAVDHMEAFDKIEADAPDLITFDLAMSKMSGVKLQRRLNKNENWKNIPIVIITAYARHKLDKKDVNEFYAVAAKKVPERILAKSITPPKLIEAIDKILSVDPSERFSVERSDIINMVKFCAPEKLSEIRNILA